MTVLDSSGSLVGHSVNSEADPLANSGKFIEIGLQAVDFLRHVTEIGPCISAALWSGVEVGRWRAFHGLMLGANSTCFSFPSDVTKTTNV
jgi:hypothetical protein